VLEWGAGASTIWFSRLSTSQNVVSVKNDPKWHAVIQASFHEAHLQAKVHLCPEKPAYLEAFRSSEIMPPDLILIDGIWREECLGVALPFVKQGTCIIFHDTHAKPYQKALRQLPSGVKRRDFYGPCWGIKNFRGWSLLERA
jgi:predicted O-methyltransferase YrrM